MARATGVPRPAKPARHAGHARSHARTGIYLGGRKNKVSGGTSTGNGDYDVRGCAVNTVKKVVVTTLAPECL